MKKLQCKQILNVEINGGGCEKFSEAFTIKNRLEEWFITSERTNMCTVRSLALANYLCNNGFKIQKVVDSEKNPQFKIFLFEDNKSVRNMITKYLSQREV